MSEAQNTAIKDHAMQQEIRGRTTPFVVGPDDGEATWFLATRMIVKATAQNTGGTFGLRESRLQAGQDRARTTGH